jgi:hypothetical protein
MQSMPAPAFFPSALVEPLHARRQAWQRRIGTNNAKRRRLAPKSPGMPFQVFDRCRESLPDLMRCFEQLSQALNNFFFRLAFLHN